ncbi:MAG TPA: WecB/TagA/CpsF family glycosyltransferase [Tepidisphaeraceae bacterium]|nr:WecB/TagA/CpsF family glycosyltransferase [Tepidisphaeraceae bacterium]
MVSAPPTTTSDDAAALAWPRKLDLFGVGVSATTYDEAERLVMAAARVRRSAVVTHLPVHGVVTAALDRGYAARVASFDLVAPDGQPVRWALNKFYRTALPDRVYGPELMLRLCRAAARQGVGVYLYGSTTHVLDRLADNLRAECPGLDIVGTESPPFRPLSAAEAAAAVGRINASGAGLVFLGLGLPRQDVFAHEHRDRVRAVMLCVGAAFDFHAKTKKSAPPWMQRRGLEWLFRLAQEPGRLWQRYLFTNSVFVALVTRRMLWGPR